MPEPQISWRAQLAADTGIPAAEPAVAHLGTLLMLRDDAVRRAETLVATLRGDLDEVASRLAQRRQVTGGRNLSASSVCVALAELAALEKAYQVALSAFRENRKDDTR
jgi:hypothetical protein